jgi:Dipeptidyl aminopeptidases/acylaminoacyl-peptidases
LFDPRDFQLEDKEMLKKFSGEAFPTPDVIFEFGTSNTSVPGIYGFDLTRQIRAVMYEMEDVYKKKRAQAWTVLERGEPSAMIVRDDKLDTWTLSIRLNGAWRDVPADDVTFDQRIVAFGPESGTLMFDRVELGEIVTRRLSMVDATWGEALPKEWQGDKYIFDKSTRSTVGRIKFEPRYNYLFYDTGRQNAWDKITQSFPSEDVRLESWADDWKRLIVRVFGRKTGLGYFLVDLEKGQTNFLGDRYRNLPLKDIATVKPVSYTSADGLQITADLTLPNGRTQKKMPLVVVPPTILDSHHEQTFDWFAQALASRGYLVLQPNPRGSIGRGLKFLEAGNGELTDKVLTDLEDGVEALVKLGIVDPQRVCIVGMNYGGFMALASAAFKRDVYRCAVSVDGFSDLPTEAQHAYINSQRTLLRLAGADSTKDPKLIDRSPARHAETITASIMLIHSNIDRVINFNQSQIMASALKKAGKPYEFVKLNSEDHWLATAETRLSVLQAVVKFLEKNNPP